MLVTDYGKHKEMDGWMDGVRSSQHARAGQRERGSQTLGRPRRRKSSFNEASRNLQRTLRQEGLEWRSRPLCHQRQLGKTRGARVRSGVDARA